MGTILASAIVATLRADLVDANARTWSDPDLLECLNEAIRAACDVDRTLYVRRESIALVAGEDQTLPAGGTSMVRPVRNSGGNFVTTVSQDLLAEATRFSAVPAQQAEVSHVYKDPRDPRRFGVWPPNDGSGSLVVEFTAVPDEIASGDAIPIDDSKQPALLAYAMGAAYRRNTLRQDVGKTQAYTQRFLSLLGLGAQAQTAAAAQGQ